MEDEEYASGATYLMLALGLEKIQRLDLVEDLCKACKSRSCDGRHGGGEKGIYDVCGYFQ